MARLDVQELLRLRANRIKPETISAFDVSSTNTKIPNDWLSSNTIATINNSGNNNVISNRLKNPNALLTTDELAASQVGNSSIIPLGNIPKYNPWNEVNIVDNINTGTNNMNVAKIFSLSDIARMSAKELGEIPYSEINKMPPEVAEFVRREKSNSWNAGDPIVPSKNLDTSKDPFDATHIEDPGHPINAVGYKFNGNQVNPTDNEGLPLSTDIGEGVEIAGLPPGVSFNTGTIKEVDPNTVKLRPDPIDPNELDNIVIVPSVNTNLNRELEAQQTALLPGVSIGNNPSQPAVLPGYANLSSEAPVHIVPDIESPTKVNSSDEWNDTQIIFSNQPAIALGTNYKDKIYNTIGEVDKLALVALTKAGVINPDKQKAFSALLNDEIYSIGMHGKPIEGTMLSVDDIRRFNTEGEVNLENVGAMVNNMLGKIRSKNQAAKANVTPTTSSTADSAYLPKNETPNTPTNTSNDDKSYAVGGRKGVDYNPDETIPVPTVGDEVDTSAEGFVNKMNNAEQEVNKTTNDIIQMNNATGNDIPFYKRPLTYVVGAGGLGGLALLNNRGEDPEQERLRLQREQQMAAYQQQMAQ